MKVFLDQNLTEYLRDVLPTHAVRHASEMGWSELSNGELLSAADAAGFDIMLTADLPRPTFLPSKTVANPAFWCYIHRMSKVASDKVRQMGSQGRFTVRETTTGRSLEIKGAGSLKDARLTFQRGIDLTKPIAAQVMRESRRPPKKG